MNKVEYMPARRGSPHYNELRDFKMTELGRGLQEALDRETGVGTVGAIVDAHLDEVYEAIKRRGRRQERESWVFRFNPSQK